MLLAYYSHKHISYPVRTTIRKAILLKYAAKLYTLSTTVASSMLKSSSSILIFSHN
ncbi:hypothetical protein [Wolbachia endosymbiont (group A) of Pherbina coryleti]|uniref:hypothetical protein n=1 Tax=Wolbachia endosymbiont (group A) of Pherbina coryleti TaxID=3066153 RepID=UPI0031334136